MTTVKARDAYDSMTEREDSERKQDTKKAYGQAAAMSDTKRKPVAQLQRMGRVFLKEWDNSFKRPTRKAANALKVLTQVPLSSENTTYFFEQSLRESFLAALNEEAEHDLPENDPKAGYLVETETRRGGDAERSAAKWYAARREREAVREIFRQAIRIDATENDVQRVMRAIKSFED